jgi:hypothetical protein
MTPWFRDRATLAFIGARYLPLLAGLNLVWEIAQLPLYTIWREASPRYLAFAVAHCTAGDVLIGAAALALALTGTRARSLSSWHWRTIVLATTVVGMAYAVTSEGMNTSLRPAWQYSALMPTLRLGAIPIGLSPLAQWLVLPPLALYLSRRLAR